MLRPWSVGLVLGAALLCAGCFVVETPSPAAPTAPLVTSTPPPTALVFPSATAITIQTATPTVSPAPSSTLSAPATQTPSATPSSTIAVSPSDTPSGTPGAAADTATPLPPASATAPPLATAPPISIVSFKVSPVTINPGESVTLTWEAVGEQVTLYRLDALGRLAELFSVPISGSLTLPTPAGQRGQVNFALFATAGGSSASASVSAAIRCPDNWFFANPPTLCPGSPPNQGTLAAEHFEHGLMLWTAYQDRIYLLYGDGASPRWDAQQNGWFAGQPESDPNLAPPAGFFQPVRGFGLTWRTGYVSPSQVVRDRLGWATEPEASLQGAVQCDSAPKYNRCYLSAPGGGVYVLEPERSDWHIWLGP